MTKVTTALVFNIQPAEATTGILNVAIPLNAMGFI